MQYTSTRDSSLSVSSSYAIAHGISAEGGLFLPCEIPQVDLKWIRRLCDMEYPQRAQQVLSLFLTDFKDAELAEAVEAAYTNGVFEEDWAAPLSDLSDGRFVLELWHGPTCAFKDMALQLLPHLMVSAARRVLDGKQILILVATSGDTGKAALEGFHDVDGVKIAVFYPNEGVSPMQQLQMATQKGDNVAVYAIEGNFDNAQTEVKKIFTDPEMIRRMAACDTVFSSANSINWGRLVPQIVYYFSAYADLVACECVKLGDPVNFVVPTGNFGNILAGYYAKRMGLPVNKLICASNRNDVLTDFMHNGVYDANRSFYTTISPSMDILISSNLERLLYELCGKDDRQVAEMMQQLKENRRYAITPEMKEKLDADFWGGAADEDTCRNIIRKTLDEIGYLIDPHTAVAFSVYEQYKAETGDTIPAIILSTASPFKFAGSVLEALGAQRPADEFAAVKALSEGTGAPVPESLAALEKAKIRFTKVLLPDEMPREIELFASRK
ncbi:MAG: threonine synthase [Oscillospiraceae bacterium]|nr:MAG: threonine synthase [Oscillospiraceae bacterium]